MNTLHGDYVSVLFQTLTVGALIRVSNGGIPMCLGIVTRTSDTGALIEVIDQFGTISTYADINYWRYWRERIRKLA